ncbi:hypothetical protein GCM10010985_45730 [Caballeronia grimmiae]|uniref:Uncharacterized protein n=1 Tax=Caballeronia grimmiae TaxID=1071679 RepID=A0ABQ1S014_9BURK|nr:hypothetical protein GCM10010985_45730 [Caballeronia grimmiae]
MEAVRAGGPQVALPTGDGHAHGTTVVGVRCIRILPQRTNAAVFVANSGGLARLKRTELRRTLPFRFQAFRGELLPFFGRQLRKIEAVPFPNPESRS